MLPLFGVMLALDVAPSPSPAPMPPPLPVTAALAARLDAQLPLVVGTQRGQTPALSVAIVEHGAIVYARVFGQASAQTRFPIASITKMFTAVAIMQLVEAHRVDLDATVATYVPDAPHAHEITIRQLLQHTSGLWDYGDTALATGRATQPTTPQQILAYAATHPLTAPPGTGFAYSNTGYVVLGLVVERASGQPFATYVREHIFAPAGMHETSFDRAEPNAPMATGYMSAAGPIAPAYDPSWFFADGDLVSTASDLARFDIALANGTLVSPATFALMQSECVPNGNARQGLGVVEVDVLGLHVVGHHGGVPGFETENELVPADRTAVIVLSDAFDFITARANQIVFSALYPRLAVVQAPIVAAVEDPVITARFRASLAGLVRGEMQRDRYTDAINAALTPEVLQQTAVQLHALGTIASTKFLGWRSAGNGGMAYAYAVTFSNGATMTWTFALAPDGKIAGIGSAG